MWFGECFLDEYLLRVYAQSPRELLEDLEFTEFGSWRDPEVGGGIDIAEEL